MPASLSPGRLVDDDEGVHGDGTVRAEDDRVEVHLTDGRLLDGEPGDRNDDVGLCTRQGRHSAGSQGG